MKYRIFLLLLLPFSLIAQSKWFGERMTESHQFSDPTEVQFSGTATAVPERPSDEYQYMPFSIGAGQSIWSSQKRNLEVLMELGAFTQFEWDAADKEQQRNLINTDYRIAFSLLKNYEKYLIRLRFYHVSSHLGDDYIIRNEIRSYTENKVNYEQLDITGFWMPKEGIKAAAGFGYVVRFPANRKPLSGYSSWEHDILRAEKNWGLTYAANLKVKEETDFQPGCKFMGGIHIKREYAPPVRFLFEYYNGHLPYSQFEQEKVEWYGLGLYFSIN